MSIDGTFSASLTINDRQPAGLAGISALTAAQQILVNISNGTGAKQGTQLYPFTRTFSGTTDLVNLTSLVGMSGNAIDFTTIKGVFILNNSAVDNLVVGDAGSDPWATLLNSTGTITLLPLGFFLAGCQDATGWVVTASTAMNLLFTGTSGQSYNLVLWG
jgi:hypothetical protein